MNQILLGMILIIVAGFLQGTFGLFIKQTKTFKWENSWLVFSIVALFISPLLLTIIFAPEFIQVLSNVSTRSILIPMFFGFLWGIGSVLFGLCLNKIGVSLTYTIILGMATLIGTSLPIYINKVLPNGEILFYLISGLILILGGIILSGFSGVLRDKNKSKISHGFVLGLVLAVISGLFSPMLNVGFVNGKNISLEAQEIGISTINATFIIWMVILFSGFLVNLFYSTHLLFKNKSFVLLNKDNVGFVFFPILAGIFWFISFVLFGISSINIGSLGSSVGWGIFIGLSIVISNIWGIVFGEWKGSTQALKYQLLSVLIIVVGVGLIATSTFL